MKSRDELLNRIMNTKRACEKVESAYYGISDDIEDLDAIAHKTRDVLHAANDAHNKILEIIHRRNWENSTYERELKNSNNQLRHPQGYNRASKTGASLER